MRTGPCCFHSSALYRCSLFKPQFSDGLLETGWRAPHVGEGTVRLSPKGESGRITQRSAVQIRPPQPRTPLPKCDGVLLFPHTSFSSHKLLTGAVRCLRTSFWIAGGHC